MITNVSWPASSDSIIFSWLPLNLLKPKCSCNALWRSLRPLPLAERLMVADLVEVFLVPPLVFFAVVLAIAHVFFPSIKIGFHSYLKRSFNKPSVQIFIAIRTPEGWCPDDWRL